MSVGTKKLIGSLALLFGLIVYIVLALQIGARLPHMMLVELPFYIFAGLAWIYPARSIIVWMHK